MANSGWKMPEWMEPYREQIEAGLGGNSAEECMNDDSTFDTNLLMSVFACQCSAKVGMLMSLYDGGRLA
jgi:hypothetical protein